MTSMASMKWRTQDSADANRIRSRPGPQHDRDKRNHRLGQGRANRRQEGPDRPFGQTELVTEPLDCLGAELGAEQEQERHRRTDDRFRPRTGPTRSGTQVLRRVRQEGHVAGPLESDRQLTLMAGTRSRLAPGLDLGPFR